MIYVVLGMHKSGTTLISQILHASGINMGEFNSALDYDRNNKYERHATQELNREILHGLLIPPLDYLLRRPFRPPVDQAGYRRNKDSVAIIRQRALQRKLNNLSVPDKMSRLITDLQNKHRDWGFKDPRTCLTYDLWRKALPDHRIIIVYRHYNQLLVRYKAQGSWAHTFRVMHGWTHHNLANLNTAKLSRQPVLWISYEALMNSEQSYQELSTFLERDIVDRRDPNLYRNRVTRPADVPPVSQLVRSRLPVDPDTLYQHMESFRKRQQVSL